MPRELDIARIAALVGEPARAAILLALGDGRALPAGELAACANVSAPTASDHLRQLREAGLLERVRQGRHHYYRLASAEVGAMLESLMLVAAQGAASRLPVSRVDPLLQAGRTCYSHLAGRLGVGICDALIAHERVLIEEDLAHFSPDGVALLLDFGVNVQGLERHPVSKTCIDWSERRHHLSGPVGVAIYRRCLELGWVRHHLDSRAVSVTPSGQKGLRKVFGFGR